MMARIVGLVGVVLVAVFLGYYVYIIRATPLAVIIGAILIMVLVDYIQSTKPGADENGSANPS